MFEIWYVSIGLAIVSIVFSIFIIYEFANLRGIASSKITRIFVFISVILLLDGLSNLIAFSMWSGNRDPYYVYPALSIAIFSTAGIILLYYYISRV
ncbi:hypothetical protein CM19_08230 [Candidatus Acidianus copahuensis]|uniref:Uncharacterized protein n=2 Tax=Sulfolobaceae TaxID=118883 RepID=A0A031LPE2_9CREN|nr:hypothetical protein CM19_08230 [Candidatus Acidianus copahuensis]NON61385.1 hypothetical protein [Acidianus sp. RZ1]